MLPLLRIAGDGKEHLFRVGVETLGERFKLTPAERQQELPSRTQLISTTVSAGRCAVVGSRVGAVMYRRGPSVPFG